MLKLLRFSWKNVDFCKTAMEFIKDESKNSQIIKISKFNSLKNPQKLAKKLEIYVFVRDFFKIS